MTRHHTSPATPVTTVTPVRLVAALWALCALCGGCSDSGGSGAHIASGNRGDAGGGSDGSVSGDIPTLTGDGIVVVGSDGYPLCEYGQGDVLSFASDPRPRTTASASVGDELALGYQSEEGDLHLLAVAPTGDIGEPVRVLAASAGVRAPQLVSADGHLLLAWQTPAGPAAGDGMRLWVRSLDDPSPTQRELGLLPTENDGAPGLAAFADSYVAGYLPLGSDSARIVRLGGDGAVAGADVSLDVPVAGAARSVQLSKLGSDTTLAAWLQADGDAGMRVMAQVLDAELATVGGPVELSDGPVLDAPFSITGRSGSAGVLYQSMELQRIAIKFRRIELDGQTEGPLLNVVPAPGRAIDGAITAFGQGYAVAYRALPSRDVTEPEVHVAFINETGHVVHDATLDVTSEAGGTLSVAATEAGYLLLAWKTVSPSGATSQSAQRLYCPGALLLCGGHVTPE